MKRRQFMGQTAGFGVIVTATYMEYQSKGWIV